MFWKAVHLFIFGLVSLFMGSAMAQDPTKVEPAHYKLGFENAQVQVIHIHYGPHSKSSLHEHPAGVVVNLSNAHLRFTDQNGASQEVRALHGEARWFPAVKHRVENLSDSDYDGIYIAVKGGGNAAGISSGGSAEEISNAFLLAGALQKELPTRVAAPEHEGSR